MADIPKAEGFEPTEDGSKIDQSNAIPKAEGFEPLELSSSQQKALQRNQQIVQTAVPAVMQEAAFGDRRRPAAPKTGSTWEYMKNQWKRNSILGMLNNPYDPNDVMAPTGVAQEYMGMIPSLLGDAPGYIGGGAVGTVAGTAAGTALGGPAGGTVGGALGGYGLGMAVPEAIKSYLRGEGALDVAKNFGKGGAIGLTGGAISRAAPLVNPIMRKLLPAVEVSGMAAVSSGLEGKPLKLKDIGAMAFPYGLMKGGTKLGEKAVDLARRRRAAPYIEQKLAEAESMPTSTPEEQLKKREAIKGVEALRGPQGKLYEGTAGRPFEPTEEELQKRKADAEAKGTVKITEADTTSKKRKKIGETGGFDDLPFGEMISDQARTSLAAEKARLKEAAVAERRRLKEEKVALKQAEKEKKAAVEKQASIPEKIIEDTQRQAQQLVDNATGRPVQEQVDKVLSRRKRKQAEREESDRLYDRYDKHLDTLGITPEGKAESLRDFDNLKHEGGIEAQRARILSIYTPDPEVAPSPEYIAKAQALKAKVEADNLVSNREKRIADIQILKDNGWSESQIAEMNEKSLTAALRKVRNHRTNLVDRMPEDVDRMLDFELSVAEEYDRIGTENPPSDMELVEVLKMAQALDITPINDVAKEAIRRQGTEDAPGEGLTYAELKKKNRELIAASVQRVQAQKAAAQAALSKTEPVLKVDVRRRKAKSEQEVVGAKEEALRKLIEEQEADRKAQEEGRAFEEDSVEDMRFKEQERKRQGYGPYDWEDRSVAQRPPIKPLDAHSQLVNYIRSFKHIAWEPWDKVFQERQAKSRAAISKYMDLVRKGGFNTEADTRAAMVFAYQMIPRNAAEWATHMRDIAVIEDAFARIPKGDVDAFTTKSVIEAMNDKTITLEEAEHILNTLKSMKVNPNFEFSIKKVDKGGDLSEVNFGGYTLVTNSLNVKSPHALAHEIMHWAWYNVLSRADRAMFMEDFHRRFYKEDGRPNYYRMGVETSDPANAMKGPGEMFASRGSDYHANVILSQTERTLFQKIRDFWMGLFKTTHLKKPEGTFEGVTELFDKVWDKGNRIMPEEGTGKMRIEGIDPTISDAFMDEMTLWHGTNRLFKQFRDKFMSSGSGGQMRGWGHYFSSLREVEVPDNLNLLDLDNTISKDQAKKIGYALAIEVERSKRDHTIVQPRLASEMALHFQKNTPYMTGDEIQNNLQRVLGGKREASEFLRDKCGIHGNTYIGESSGVRNYVIFDENIPQIKNSVTLDMLGLQQVYEKLYNFMRSKMTDDQIKNKPTFINGELRRLGDAVDEMTSGRIPDESTEGVRKEAAADILGLSSMRDRMRAIYRDAKLLHKVKTEGDKIAAEVKGEDAEGNMIKIVRNEKDPANSSLIKQWFFLPRSKQMFGGTKAEPYWFRLNARDLYYQFMHDQDKIRLDNIYRSLGNKPERFNAIRQVIEGKNKTPDPQLLEASMQVKEWLDKKKAKMRTFLLDEYKRELNTTEYNALMDMIAGRDSMDVKAKYGKKINYPVIDDLWKKYNKVQKWGIDDYIPNYEFGRVKIIIKEPTPKGKEERQLIAIGLNELDAVRKIQKHMEETGYKGMYYVDTGASDLFTKPVGISRNQYLGMLGRFQNELGKSIKMIDAELAKSMGKDRIRDIGRRSIKAAHMYVEPSDKWSPYFEPRHDILKGEENLLKLLNHYSYSVEKKMALDPVIDDIRSAIKDKVFTDNQSQAFIDLINDVKSTTYWWSDHMADSLLHNVVKWGQAPFKVDFDYRPYRSLSNAASSGRQLEANLKLGYRAVAAFVNLSSGQIHAITKAGHKYWWDAVNFIKTDEGRRFLEQVEPYLGTTLVEKAGHLQSKVPLWKPLGLFQAPEPFNRSVSAAARYLMSREKMSEKAAIEDAIRATWYEQFTYNMASLPRLMREPVGKTVMQFFPYVLNELSFINNLTPREWVRYASYQMALGGFRGLVLTMKTLPIIAACGWWQEAMDYLEDMGNAAMNNVVGGALYRGVFGAAAALFGEQGARAMPDVTGAASISLMPRVGEGGPLINDMLTLYKAVSSGAPFSITEETEEPPYRRFRQPQTTPATQEYRKAFQNIVAAAGKWNNIWDYWVDENHHVLDRKLQAIDQVPDLPAPEAVSLLANSALGSESLYHSAMKTARNISDRELKRENLKKGAVTDKGTYDFIRGQGISPDTVERMKDLQMNTTGLERSIKFEGQPIQTRRMPGESWRLYRRRLDRFPTFEEEETQR